MKNICVVTGSRAEYGLLKPVMQAIQKNRALKLSIIAAGMHLSQEFGNSIKDIIADGFTINAKIKMDPKNDSGFSMAHEVGKGIAAMAKAYNIIKPDIVLILGDRLEPLAAAIAASYMNLPIAHLHGGDRTFAGIDEPVRHAITKLAHIHFPATKKSAERIAKMGEDKWRIHVVGSPSLDTILNINLLTKKDIEKRFNVDLRKPIVIMLQHSVTTEIEKAGNQAKETLEALKKLKYQTIIIYSNNDAGGREIISKIKKYEKLPFIKAYPNLHYLEYLSLLNYANVLVGNSSSGIIGSASFKLPVVNIGIRQEGRERANNVIDVAHNKRKIISAINYAMSPKFKHKLKNCKEIYGDGKTGLRIAGLLTTIEINEKLLKKKIVY